MKNVLWVFGCILLIGSSDSARRRGRSGPRVHDEIEMSSVLGTDEGVVAGTESGYEDSVELAQLTIRASKGSPSSNGFQSNAAIT